MEQRYCRSDFQPEFVEKIRADTFGSAGARISAVLKSRGEFVGLYKAGRLMNETDLKSCQGIVRRT